MKIDNKFLVFNKSIIVVALAAIFSGCSELEIFEDDIDVDANNRTTNVTISNMEPIAAAAIDSSYLAIAGSPIFSALDAGQAQQNLQCVTGVADINSSKSPGDEYAVGDTITVDFQNCLFADGRVLNGRASYRYTAIDGLNRRFRLANADECLGSVSRDISGVPTFDSIADIFVLEDDGQGNMVANPHPDVITNFKDGEFFPADQITFVQVGNELDARFVKLSEPDADGIRVFEPAPPIGVSPLDAPTIRISDNKIAIIFATEVNPDRSSRDNLRYRLLTQDPLAPTFPSLEGGDIFYSVKGVEAQVESCQAFERKLRLVAGNLTYSPLLGDQVVLNGELSLIERTDDLSSGARIVDDSDFSVRYNRINLNSGATDRYSYNGFTASITANFGDQSVSGDESLTYTLSGEVSSSALFGTVLISSVQNVRASFDDFIPEAGQLRVLGRDLDTVNVLFQGAPVFVSAATEGDTNGSGAANTNEQVNTFWQNLIDGNFLRSDEE